MIDALSDTHVRYIYYYQLTKQPHTDAMMSMFDISSHALPCFVKNSDEYLPSRAMDRGIGPRSSMMCARWSSSRV